LASGNVFSTATALSLYKTVAALPVAAPNRTDTTSAKLQAARTLRFLLKGILEEVAIANSIESKDLIGKRFGG
jgi:hypothetical protein